MPSLFERLRDALAPRYEVEGEVASGGMAIVYRARDTSLDRVVAVKVLRPDMATATGEARFLREARTLASFSHPNMVAIHDAVRHRLPLIERAVTITGDGVDRPGNLLVRIGTSIPDLLAARGVKHNVSKLLLGGPMMGLAQYTLDLPVTKGVSGLLAMTHAALYEPQMCIRCGACVQHCPMRLVPSYLSLICEAKDLDAIAASDILDCKLCGCCTR